MTNPNVNQVVAKELTVEELKAQIEMLRAQNAELSKTKATMGMKITEKGGLSVYGLGRFPVTLYKSQWIKLIGDGTAENPGFVDKIREFIKANPDKLLDKAKGQVEEHVKAA